MRIAAMASEDSDTGIKIYLREIGQIRLLTPQDPRVRTGRGGDRKSR